MTIDTNPEVLIRAENLVKEYEANGGLLAKLTGKPIHGAKAVNGVSFDIHKGETLGLIGESGCGKSTLGRTVLRLHDVTSGRLSFKETDVTALDESGLKAMRRKMQMIFQDPYASLNPRKTVAQIIGMPLDIHNIGEPAERREKVIRMMENVGLKENQINRYPHQFSGGQRQRIGIARALILEPEFIVCDEPVSALDVSIQAQILKLLENLRSEMDLTYMFISHDISVISHISDRIAVMYLGAIMEIGPAKEIVNNPQHPYTQALISAVPRLEKSKQGAQRIVLQGDLPSPLNLPSGCLFQTRCPQATEICRQTKPAIREISAAHQVACHLIDVNNL